ncbi:MAG: saccharopine dehydrogenase family protein [Solirubrobacteraceae bacterium]
MPSDRSYDIVLFGATGFTGALTAEYLSAHAGADTRWALAGRNRAKLDALAARLGGAPDILQADVGDAASLQRVAESARVVITTVGPYIRYGEPLVAACAEAGTDYVDLTGEPEFVDRMFLAHHERAVQTGARIVHACGFDSIPHDLGVQFTVEQLPEGVPIAVKGYLSAGGTLSGGTFDTAVTSFSRARQTAQAHADRRRVEPEPAGRRVRAIAGRPGRASAVGGYALPLPTIDPQIVTASARALDRYGPDFSYSHYVRVSNPLVALALPAGVATLFALAQLPPARSALRRLRPSGAGPSPEQRARNWFRVRFVGEGGGRRVITQVSGGDPGYGETSKMLAESALCLAHDELPPTAGQVTTAAAMGTALRERLQRAGMAFEVLETANA